MAPKNNAVTAAVPANAAPTPTTAAPACDISAVPGMIQSMGLVDFNVKCQGGQVTITGTSQDGKHHRVTSYQNNGYTEGSMSTFQGSTTDRKAEAERLRNTGLTQQAIADRLGVSQKTISNYLTK